MGLLDSLTNIGVKAGLLAGVAACTMILCLLLAKFDRN